MKNHLSLIIVGMLLISTMAFVGNVAQRAHAASPNLAVNPGFENGLAGWTISAGTAAYSVDCTTSHSGLYSCKGVETDTGSLGRLYQDVTGITSPGNQYQISGWIKTSNVIGNAVIALDYVRSDGWTPLDGYVMDWIGSVSGTQGWAFFQSPVFTLVPMPSDCKALWFLFDFNNGAGTAWWDDVSLICVSPSPDFQLRVSPTTQSVPITENATFSVQILGVNGFSSDVQLSVSGLPAIFEPSFSLPTIRPYQTSLQISYLTMYVDASVQIGASYDFTINAKSGQLSHFQSVTFTVTKTVGVKNILYISSITEAGITKVFTIQQNFLVYVPNPSGKPSIYWAQNVLFFETVENLKYQMAASFQVFDDTDWVLDSYPHAGCNPNPPGLIYANVLVGPIVNFPATFNLTSVLSGDELIFTNNCTSWPWKIPDQNGQRAFIWNYDQEAQKPSRDSPEFVMVGDPSISNPADFQSQTSGYVESFAELNGSPWASSVWMTAANAHWTMTNEYALGLQLAITSMNTASFSNSPNGYDEGVFFVPMSSSLLEGGATTETQPAVSVTISGSSAPDGTPVTILASSLSGPPIGVAPVGTSTAAYYDVNVQGISDGMATVSITNGGVLGQTTMQYWNGAQWVEATAVVVSRNTICGNIPVSALTGTIIAIGPLIGPSPVGGEWAPINTTQLVMPWILLALFAIAAAGATSHRLLKKRR